MEPSGIIDMPTSDAPADKLVEAIKLGQALYGATVTNMWDNDDAAQFIARALTEAGLVAKAGVMTPPAPAMLGELMAACGGRDAPLNSEPKTISANLAHGMIAVLTAYIVERPAETPKAWTEAIEALKPFADAWERLRDPLPQGPFNISIDAMACCRARAALDALANPKGEP